MTLLDDTKALKGELTKAQTLRAHNEALLFGSEAALHAANLVIAKAQGARQPIFDREAEADARTAETRALIAAQELLQNTYSAEASRIQADELKRIEDNYLASNVHNHVVNFSDDITDDTVRQCIHLLTTWDRLDPVCDIEIIFDCNGGEAWAGLHLFDYIVSLKKAHKITITAIGKTASMAAILVQAGTVRRMGANSFMMLHELSAGTSGKSSEMAEQMELIHKIEKNIINMIAGRSTITERQLTTMWKKKDVWMTAQEALEKGLIDEIGS